MILLIVSDVFHTEYISAKNDATFLDEALRMWADPDNDGCMITAELPDGTAWWFNPAQHERFVHGPVEV